MAIDTVDDMSAVFDGLPIDRLSVNFTINATSPIILAFYLVAAERQGAAFKDIAGTLQNDILKEFLARKTFIFPPAQSIRLVADVVEYASRQLPRFNGISITGYHAREAGCNAIQELGFTMASAIAYSNEFIARGMSFDDFAPRLSFHVRCAQPDQEAPIRQLLDGLQRVGLGHPACGRRELEGDEHVVRRWREQLVCHVARAGLGRYLRRDLEHLDGGDPVEPEESDPLGPAAPALEVAALAVEQQPHRVDVTLRGLVAVRDVVREVQSAPGRERLPYRGRRAGLRPRRHLDRDGRTTRGSVTGRASPRASLGKFAACSLSQVLTTMMAPAFGSTPPCKD